MYLHFYYLSTKHLQHIALIYIQRCQHCQQHQYASIISTIHLYCLADRKLRYALGTILFFLLYVYHFLFHYSMRYDTASSTYTLQIKDVQRPDEGTYQCQIIVAINNKVTKSVDLTVAQPPVITDNSTRSVVVEVGNPVELICHALGSPPPSVSWRRQNHQILPTGGVQVPIYLLIPDN